MSRDDLDRLCKDDVSVGNGVLITHGRLINSPFSLRMYSSRSARWIINHADLMKAHIRSYLRGASHQYVALNVDDCYEASVMYYLKYDNKLNYAYQDVSEYAEGETNIEKYIFGKRFKYFMLYYSKHFLNPDKDISPKHLRYIVSEYDQTEAHDENRVVMGVSSLTDHNLRVEPDTHGVYVDDDTARYYRLYQEGLKLFDGVVRSYGAKIKVDNIPVLYHQLFYVLPFKPNCEGRVDLDLFVADFAHRHNDSRSVIAYVVSIISQERTSSILRLKQKVTEAVRLKDRL